MRMPRPPPPKAALMAIGRPCSSANARASAASATGPSVPGTSGAPARTAISRAVTLLPSASITSAVGPIHVRPAATTARAKSAFSERNPYPGCTASAPQRSATASTAGMLR